MWKSLMAIAAGAVCGAWLRWWLGSALNAAWPSLPPGTLVANLVGAFVIGVALQVAATSAALSPEWRLVVITGFCGSLTTFSTFSAELLTLLQAGRFAWAAGHLASHVLGSLAATLAGLWAAGTLRGLARLT